MQKPLTITPARQDSADSILYGRRLSIVRFFAAIALFLITLAIFFAQDGRGDSVITPLPLPSEFSSGMPLP